MLDVQLEQLRISMRKKRILQSRIDALKDHLLKEDKNAQIEDLQELKDELAEAEEEEKNPEPKANETKPQDTSTLLLAVLAQSLQVQQAMLNNTMNNGSRQYTRSPRREKQPSRENSYREEPRRNSRVVDRRLSARNETHEPETVDNGNDEASENDSQDSENEDNNQEEVKPEKARIPSLKLTKKEDKKRPEKRAKKTNRKKKKEEPDPDEESDSEFQTNDLELDEFLRETKKALQDTDTETNPGQSARTIEEIIDTARKEELKIQSINYTRSLARRRFERIVIIATFVLHMKQKREARIQLFEDSRQKLKELIDRSSDGAEKYLTQLVRIPLYSLLSDGDDLDVFSGTNGLKARLGVIGDIFGIKKTEDINDKEMETKEFQARAIKIKTKIKIIIESLYDIISPVNTDESKKEDTDKNRLSIVRFFAIMTHEFVLFPKDYLWHTEKNELRFDKNGALIEMDARRAKVMIVNFLISRILVLRIFRDSRGSNSKIKKNLKIIQTLLYCIGLLATKEQSVDRVESLGPAIVQLMDPRMAKEIHDDKKLDRLIRVFGDFMLDQELVVREIAEILYELSKENANSEIDDTSPFLNYRIATNKQKRSYQKFSEYVAKKLVIFEENMAKMRQLQLKEEEEAAAILAKANSQDTDSQSSRTNRVDNSLTARTKDEEYTSRSSQRTKDEELSSRSTARTKESDPPSSRSTGSTKDEPTARSTNKDPPTTRSTASAKVPVPTPRPQTQQNNSK
jgi:hypothetical protein